MLDTRAKRVRQCVTIVKISGEAKEYCTHGSITKQLEKLLDFNVEKALKLVVPKSNNPSGYAVFNHYTKRGYWVDGSFTDLLDSLEERGLIAE